MRVFALLSGSYGELQNTSAFLPQALVDIPALLVSCKRAHSFTFVAVYLPAAAALAVLPRVLDEPEHVLHRIAEKKPDLMWKPVPA